VRDLLEQRGIPVGPVRYLGAGVFGGKPDIAGEGGC
jgi:hypothetical protein